MRITYRMRLGSVQLLFTADMFLFIFMLLAATFGRRGFDSHAVRMFSGLIFEFGVIALLQCSTASRSYIVFQDGCLTLRKNLLTKPFTVRVEDIRFIDRKTSCWRVQTDSKSFFLPDNLENIDDLLARISSGEETYAIPPVAYPRRRIGLRNG